MQRARFIMSSIIALYNTTNVHRYIMFLIDNIKITNLLIYIIINTNVSIMYVRNLRP